MLDLSTPCLPVKSVCVRVLLRQKCVFVCLNDMCESDESVRVCVCVPVSLHESLLFAPFIGFFPLTPQQEGKV